jgi:Outer membrane protein beta-barrel domain
MMNNLYRFVLLTFIALAIAVPCHAQVFLTREVPRKGSVEVSGGGVFQGGTDLTNQTATLTRNPSTGSEPLELFRADTTVATGYGIQGRIGYYFTRTISIEGGVQLARPDLRVRLSGDFEGAVPTVATESINSYLFTGSVLYHMGRGKLRPFLIGGAGHVRDLHDGDELIETGLEYHAGGGIKWWFGSGRQRVGFRAEGLFSMRDGGVGGEEDLRTVPTATVSLAYVF